MADDSPLALPNALIAGRFALDVSQVLPDAGAGIPAYLARYGQPPLPTPEGLPLLPSAEAESTQRTAAMGFPQQPVSTAVAMRSAVRANRFDQAPKMAD
jgi:hypothetical protein